MCKQLKLFNKSSQTPFRRWNR